MKDRSLLFPILNSSLNTVRDYLNNWANSLDNVNIFAGVFGNSFNVSLASTLLQNWKSGDFLDFPEIEIVAKNEINHANGAYARDNQTIYISQELLLQGNNEFIAAVILEEYGHHLDSLLNQTDTPGDEGAIFSSLIRGETIPSEQLQTIKLENDNAIVILNGQPVRIEQAAFPYYENGGATGTTVVFDTGMTQGTIILDFQTYTIPDRIEILYEGNTIYDSGFVGTGSVTRVEANFSGDSSQITVAMTPNLNNPGTAWYFTANAELNQCPDTEPLNIEAASGEFEDTDNDGDCDANGTIYIGSSEANATLQLVRVEETTAEHDSEKLRVENGTVYAQVNNISAPLFKGDFTIPFATGITSTFSETTELDNDFTLAGLEIEFNKLRIDKNQFELQGDFTIPSAVGEFEINLNAPNSLIIRDDDIRIEGGGIAFPNQQFRLFNAFEVTAEDAAIEYLPIDDELKIQGKFALVTPFLKSDPSDNSGANITLDISGDNYLKIDDGQADINGIFSVGDIALVNNWGIKELAFAITTEDGEVTDAAGTAEIVLPLSISTAAPDGIGIGVEVGLTFPDSGIELDDVRIEGNDLDIAIGTTGVFLQKLEGEVINLAPSNNDIIEFVGSIGLTYGPEISVDLDDNFLISGNFTGSAVRLDIIGSASENLLGGSTIVTVIDQNIFELTGGADFRWEENNKYLKADGFYTALTGIFSGNGDIQFDFIENKIEGSGLTNISFPSADFFDSIVDLPLAGVDIASAEFGFTYSDDGIDSNDFIAAFGQINLGFGNVGAGFRFNFDNSYEILTEEPDYFPQNNVTAELATAFELPGFEIAATNSLLSTNSFALFAQNLDISEFEETYEVEPNLDFILLNVVWDGAIDPNQIPVQILEPSGNIIKEADFDQYENIMVVEQLTNEYHKVIGIKNPVPGEWGIEIVDETGLENVRTGIYRSVEQVDPTLEIIDVSQNADGSQVTIVYEANDPDTEAKFDLKYTSNSEGDNILESRTIVSDLDENDGKGTYVWNTEGVTPGDYQIYGVIKGQHGIQNFPSNYSTETVEIINSADVSVSLSTDIEKAVVGEEVTYTATVINSSNIKSEDLKVFFSLPEGASLVSASYPVLNQDEIQSSSNSLAFEIDRLLPGESKKIDIVVTAPNSTTPSTSAAVLMLSETYDSNSDNNRDRAYISVVNPPETKPNLIIERIDRDLVGEAIERERYRTEVDLGTTYTYEIAVTNTGDGTATGVVITENIDGLDSKLNRITTSQGNYSYNRSSEIVTANIGEIAPGETETVTIEITSQAAGKRFTYSTLQYNEKQVTDEVLTLTQVNPVPVAPADLELTQTVDNLNPLVGEQVNITLELVNNGPKVASGIEITNLLPEGLSFVGANAALGNYNSTPGVWTAGNIRDGVRTSLTITALVEDAGSITNQAEITFTDRNDPDSTPGNGDVTEDDFAEVTIDAAFPNTSPTTSGIEDFIVTKNAPNLTLSLFDVFDDAEDADTDLVYFLENNTNSELFEGIELDSESGSLTLNFTDNLLGSADITISANDPYEEFVSTNFTVSAIDSGKDNDTLYGGIGNDYLDGGKKEDRLLGLEGNDTLIGDKGKDTLYGGLGDDYIDGGKKEDYLIGEAGNDTLYGGKGKDTLYGGLGEDLLYGGKDKDTFVLAVGEGIDIIADFEPKKDSIGLTNGLTLSLLTISQNGEDTTISITNNNEMLAILDEVDANSIDHKNFTYIN